ncbi:MAG: phosphate ABC transporter ATP-binding protein, partial [Gammaproteobacteria bacterium]|nr:phosphate ABC transporter ATP-binding protein [Gammaproteobacteria bacterium]
MDSVAETAKAVKLSAVGVNVFYGAKQALNSVSIDIEDRSVTA